MKYLLTVIIPTYNRSHDLCECLSYVIPQVLLHKDRVHIYISDNASSDDTRDVVDVLIKQYPDIITYYCQKENLTASPNFDDAVNRVDSEYVYMLSDDDYIVPECISFLLKCINDYPEVEYFYLNQYIANEDMCGTYLFNKNIRKGYVTVYNTCADLLKVYFNGPSCISANLFRRDLWVNASKKKKEDCYGYVWLSILLQGVINRKSAFVQYPMFTARMPKVQRYVANWPLYYIKGMGQLFKYLDKESPGIFNAWINHQQKEDLRTFLLVVTDISQYKEKYKEKKNEILEFVNSKFVRIYYLLLLYLIPKWFARNIIRNVIRATKLLKLLK